MKRCRSRTSAIMRKELIQIARDPRSLAIALLLPVMMLIIYGYGVSTDISNIQLGIVDWSQTQQSRELRDAFVQSGYFRWVFASDRYADLGGAMDAGKVRVGLIIPPDFARKLSQGRPAPIQVLVDGADPSTATVAIGYVESILRTYSSNTLLAIAREHGFGARPQGVPPIDLRLRVWYNEELKSTNFIVPGLIAVLLMATSALLTSGTIARERERGTIEQLIASPLRSRELILGKIAAYALLSFVDVALVVLVGTLWFGVPMHGSLLLLALCSGLFLMSSLGIGLLISAAIPSQQTAMTAAIMLTMMPSVLLSGFYFPIGSMPTFIQWITYLLPARYFMVIVRAIFLKGAGAGMLWDQILPLTLLGLVFLHASIFTLRKRL